MIGISLSFCIKDICEGRVNLTDVEKIYAGTAFLSVKEAVEHYAQTYWRTYPNDAKEICQKLWAEGKIVQTRLFDGMSNFAPVLYHGTSWYPNVEAMIAGQLEDGNERWVEVAFPDRKVSSN